MEWCEKYVIPVLSVTWNIIRYILIFFLVIAVMERIEQWLDD